jgi:adenine-specific DNA-methyltransferase
MFPSVQRTSKTDEANSRREYKRELGQFLTPQPIASLLASLFDIGSDDLRLLDPGAGAGALSLALIRRICELTKPPRSVHVTAYEIDASLIERLRESFEECLTICSQSGVEFSFEIVVEDFVAAGVELVKVDLFNRSQTPFNAVILKPPYRKINSDSATRMRLSSVGIETSNLYTAFLTLSSRLLSDGGQLVSITPRSFCNGPYFKPFRKEFLSEMTLKRIHVFDSRSRAFAEDSVLQENVILHAIRSTSRSGRVLISSSSGDPLGAINERSSAYEDVVLPNDPNLFIHIVGRKSETNIREELSSLVTSLPSLCMEVSTGRVVVFRAKDSLRFQESGDTVPLIYSAHFVNGFVAWPKRKSKKPNWIVRSESTEQLLVPSGIYVLVKRFTSKEERKRIVAAVYDPNRVSANDVGFENHLNYFHSFGRGLPLEVAKGLALFLNSTLVDGYFRQFNGHTQVNATDLRSLKYPTRDQLEQLGRMINAEFPDQAEVDRLVKSEVLD